MVDSATRSVYDTHVVLAYAKDGWVYRIATKIGEDINVPYNKTPLRWGNKAMRGV